LRWIVQRYPLFVERVMRITDNLPVMEVAPILAGDQTGTGHPVRDSLWTDGRYVPG
jgi:hypothetical protein